MRGIFDLLNRFRADERGVFAVIFGLMAIVLVAMAGAAVDYTSLEMARSKAQNALDSASLGLAPTMYDKPAPTPAELIEKAQKLVVERLGATDATVDITSAEPVKATGTLTLGGTITVPMAFVQLVGIRTLTARISSQTKRGSVNIEVGVALDVTGSMEHDIDDLQTALATLIPIVVQEEQLPTYSKMAIVPYSTAVKFDAATIASIRDPITASKPVSNAAWWNSEKDISGATQARPVVITQTAHGFSNGEVIYISGVKGMTELNGKAYIVKNKSADKFDLYNTDNTSVDGRSYNAYKPGTDKMKRCIYTTCEVLISATNHGYVTDDRVAFSDFATYMTRLNDRSFQITSVDANSFKLTGVTGYSQTTFNQNGTTAVTGKLWCTNVYGCRYNYKNSKLFEATDDCVVERMTNSFTDAKPSTKKFSIYYVVGGNCEVNQAVQPLTSDLPTLEAFTAPGGLTHGGGTAGQIGTAWAWYTIAPNFAEIFTGDSAPSLYKAANTRKFVIIMTDGEYNTEHCDGVIEDDAGCAAPDGTSGTMSGAFGQAEDLCANMKNDLGITVYTVGFRLGLTGNDVDILRKCASDADKLKLAENGADLLRAFEEIGQELSSLRLSQ